MMTKIFDLAYEINGDTINLEQDLGCGEVSRVDLHPMHLRLLAEEVGILAPASNIDAALLVARLSRQMRLLADRIDRLDTMMLRIAENGRECVDEECAFSAASWELAQEFVTDLPSPLAVSVEGRAPGACEPGIPARGAGGKTGAERQKRYRERKALVAASDGGNASVTQGALQSSSHAALRHVTRDDAQQGALSLDVKQ